MTTYAVKVTLSNGDATTLSDTHAGTINEARDRYTDFVKGAGVLGGDWLNTDAYVVIARAHVVEASVTQLD